MKRAGTVLPALTICTIVLVLSVPASGGFLEDSTGLVSMEAEHFQANVPVGTHAWMPVTNTGYSGSGALQILPDDGPDPLIAGAGPRLDYQVQFTRTGTHYIWIRALSNSPASDSLYVGLDGGTAGAVSMIALNHDGQTWTWSNQARTGVAGVVNVTSLGVHTVNVWMRESGIVLDKLVLSTSAGYVPTGTGPAESASIAAAPTATTSPATSITINGAAVNGSVNPNGLSTTAWFEWGTSPTLATFSSTSNQSLGSGTTSQAVTATLSGLTSGTTYYFRVAASNSAGTSKGSIVSFSTTPAAVAPTATTSPATSITINGAAVNGSVNPNGLSTTAWFEWGTSPTLATFSSTSNQSLGSGTTSQAVTATLSGLTSGTTYYFRVAASNSAGTSKGSIVSFSTTAASPGGFLEDSTGLVSMEAEHFQANVPVGTHAWMPVTNTGYSGSGALQILPDDGPDPLIAGAGPRLDYQVQFTRTGTHYIWIRALSNSPASDSLYVGLDGGTAGAVSMIALNHDGQTWTWSNQARTGVAGVVNVTSLGVHTVNVWMRESGIVLDKLVLSTSAGYVPTGTGPAESASIAAAPTATTSPATSITINGAAVNGSVNPNGLSTTAWFEWGTSPTLATFSSTSNQSLGSGTTSQAVTATLSGLTSGTTYYFRVAASNSAGTSKGSIVSFSTTPAAVAPTATTSPATSITINGAAVNGSVNPNGLSTTAWFEWGTSPTLATFSSTSNQSLGSGTTSQAVTATLSGLTSGTTYYFRVAASNSAGTSKGSIVSFSTTPAAVAPTATTSPATSITINGAAVNGSVNPNGLSTTAWFEWGTSPTLATFSSTSNQSLGSGTTSQAVTATLSGLTSGTTYYFRVAASNSAGTSKGSIVSFSTTPAAVAPTATTSPATSITINGAAVNGSVNPNGLSTTAWFEWGTSPTLATFSSTSNQSLGSGTTSQAVTATLSGLTSGTTYYFRVAASNSAGTSKGSIVSFSTTPTSVFSWGTGTPESQGLTTARLDSMWSTLQARSTSAFLVIRNDKIVYEKYVSFNRNRKHYTASMVKTLVGGMSLMVAMQDGLISPDDLAAKYVPHWAENPIKSTITVRELATHTSGLDDAEEGNLSHNQLTGWKGDFWKRLPEPDDPFTLSRDEAPAIYPPGTTMYYSNPGYAMVSYVVSAALKGTGNQDLRSLLTNRIMNPIGIPSSEWDCGYGETYLVDGLSLVPTWGGGNYSPDATARVGRLLIRQGDWDGNRLLSPDVVRSATTHPPGLPGNALLGWWSNIDGAGNLQFPSLPEDAVYASIGNGHQLLLTIPSLNLIMVRYGELLDSGGFDLAVENYLFAPLMAAVIRPTLTTNAATSITETGATLNGSVNPNGLATTTWFEWGTSPTLATFTSTPIQSAGSGTANLAVTANLSDLAGGTTYYYRVAASNTTGTSKGSVLIFNTAVSAQAPTVTTNAATSVTATGATLNGGVNPNGQATTAWFEWGSDPTLATFSVTSNQSLGSGSTVIPFSESISGLGSNGTFYFRAVGSNSSETQKGAIESFATREDYVAVGDSITLGSHDDISADGVGYEPILSDLLAVSRGPNMIANEGVSGTSSADGAASISSILSKYPSAKYYLVMYGSNDAYNDATTAAVPSGMGLHPGDAGYDGSYKDNMQKIISAILAAGKIPYVADVPYTSDPLRSDAMIQEYNVVIDELALMNNISVVPPSFYAYFKTHQGELADGLHPNGTGYQSMANLWNSALIK